MDGQHIILLFFVINVLFSTCNSASFHVIENRDYLRAKRETGTTVNTNIVDGKDIAGVRDGSDILAKDTNSTLSAIDGSDIVNKDLKANLRGVDGSDIAGIKDGSDMISSNTNQEQTSDGQVNTGQQEIKESIPEGLKQMPIKDGTEKTAVLENVETMPEVLNQAAVSEVKETAVVSEGQESVIRNKGQSTSFHNFFLPKSTSAEKQDIQANPYLMKAFTNHGYHQGSENSYQRHNSENLKTTTPDPEGRETTPDPEQHEPTTKDPEHLETTTPDPDQPVQPSWKRHWFNPLFMTRPGELPPMALPMTASGGDKQHSEQKVEHTGNTDGNPNQETVHEMPKALPLTSHLEGQERQDVPVAMAQKGFAPSSTEMRKKGGTFSGVGKQPGVGIAERPGSQKGPGLGGAGKVRPPPKWGPKPLPATDSPYTTTPPWATTAGQGQATPEGAAGGNNLLNNMMAMNMMGGGGPGGDMFSEMMEMQRRMMRNSPQMLQQQMQMYQQMFPQMFGSGSSGTGESGGQGGNSAMPMMPMYGMGEEGGLPMAMAMANGMNLNFQSPFAQQAQQVCKKNPDSPICKMSQQQQQMMAGMPGMMPMMMGETQIEGPFGEMDMEPGEMDIEGPMAYQLLNQLNMPQQQNPMHNEITLNHHVLKALKKHFGVNTTAGIQKMATNPKFQAFMFHVLKQSTQAAPGEYHANLSQAQVNQILAGLDSSAAGNERMPPGNLDHAKLLEKPHSKGAPTSSHEAILTLDSHSPIGAQASVAQPGTFQALVAQVMGITTQKPTLLTETIIGNSTNSTNSTSLEHTASTNITELPTKKTAGAETAAILLGLPTPTGTAGPFGSVAPSAQIPTQNQLLTQQNQLLTMLAGSEGFGRDGEQNKFGERQGVNEIRNKDQIPGLSQDARNRAFGKMPKDKFGNMGGGLGANSGMAGTTATVDNRPIGMQEAGLFPGANDTVPVQKIQPSYSSSTAFAIAAIVLIALMIIVGPIFCMLCKMKEKRDERKKKMRALKNREVSENNIMEAMMLHEFGPNSVENQAAMSPNYYKNEQTRYDTIDPEIECLNQSHPLP